MRLSTSIETTLGLNLPSSLYEFVRIYGTGWFQTHSASRLLQICNPFSATFLREVLAWAKVCRQLKEAEGTAISPMGSIQKSRACYISDTGMVVGTFSGLRKVSQMIGPLLCGLQSEPLFASRNS